MSAMPKRLRAFQQVCQDNLYPHPAALPDQQGCDRRHQAVAEVLCRVPEEAYERFKRIRKSRRRSFDWFIPPLGTLGLVYPFLPNVRPRKQSMQLERFGTSILKPYARIIYLSPFLELRGRDALVYIVAHELAHVWLNHAMYSFDQEGEKAEREVYRKVCSWGFQPEARKIERLREDAASELTTPSNVCLPEEATQLIRLARAADVDMGPCYPEGKQLCIEFYAIGDIEIVFKVARCSYRVTTEQYNDGDGSDPSYRLMLLLFIPTADLSELVRKFGVYVTELAKPPQAGNETR